MPIKAHAALPRFLAWLLVEAHPAVLFSVLFNHPFHKNTNHPSHEYSRMAHTGAKQRSSEWYHRGTSPPNPHPNSPFIARVPASVSAHTQRASALKAHKGADAQKPDTSTHYQSYTRSFSSPDLLGTAILASEVPEAAITAAAALLRTQLGQLPSHTDAVARQDHTTA